MSTEQSRKRTGDHSSEDPPSKILSIPIADPSPAPHDVVLIVKGHKFYCMKEKLAEHSLYFEKMFFSEFAEKDKKEVDIGEVEPEVFQLFIDAINGIDSMSDEYSEVALVAAIFFGSSTFEDKILHYFAGNSEITLQEQFKMAEDHKSYKLMIQVCASIKDAYELDEIVPKDLDSFCNTTKNLVMQRSFELLGIRKPPLPPLPEEPDQVFEHIMNQMIDQVEVLNYHGEVLKDQVDLLLDCLFLEKHFCEKDKTAEGIIRNDPLIKELLDQLRNAHEQGERNFIYAQIKVLKMKHIYTRLQNPELIMNETLRAESIQVINSRLRDLSAIVNREKRFQPRSEKLTLGNRRVDEIYRTITAETIENNQEEPPRNMNEFARWLQVIIATHDALAGVVGYTEQHRIQRPRPDNQREVSNQASFRVIDELVRFSRILFYLAPDQNGARNEDGPNAQLGNQNPLEQDQEGN